MQNMGLEPSGGIKAEYKERKQGKSSSHPCTGLSGKVPTCPKSLQNYWLYLHFDLFTDDINKLQCSSLAIEVAYLHLRRDYTWRRGTNCAM